MTALTTTEKTQALIESIGAALRASSVNYRYTTFEVDNDYHFDIVDVATGEHILVKVTPSYDPADDLQALADALLAHVTGERFTYAYLVVQGALVDTAAAITITSSSIADPTVITTAVDHGLLTGDTVIIDGHTSVTPEIDGEHVVTVTAEDTFTIDVNVTADGVDGTATRVGTIDPGVLVAGAGAGLPTAKLKVVGVDSADGQTEATGILDLIFAGTLAT
jgi:hypothetical protein